MCACARCRALKGKRANIAELPRPSFGVSKQLRAREGSGVLPNFLALLDRKAGKNRAERLWLSASLEKRPIGVSKLSACGSSGVLRNPLPVLDKEGQRSLNGSLCQPLEKAARIISRARLAREREQCLMTQETQTLSHVLRNFLPVLDKKGRIPLTGSAISNSSCLQSRGTGETKT